MTHSQFSFDLLFEGKPKEDFKPKIEKFFERIFEYCPYLKDYHFTINTKNTFPHSSGIASSASGMAALAMNIMSLEKALHPTISEDFTQMLHRLLQPVGASPTSTQITFYLIIVKYKIAN